MSFDTTAMFDHLAAALLTELTAFRDLPRDDEEGAVPAELRSLAGAAAAARRRCRSPTSSPDSALLPEESIRWFYLDRRWTDALVQGALSVGTVEQRRPHPARRAVRRRSATSSTPRSATSAAGPAPRASAAAGARSAASCCAPRRCRAGRRCTCAPSTSTRPRPTTPRYPEDDPRRLRCCASSGSPPRCCSASSTASRRSCTSRSRARACSSASTRRAAPPADHRASSGRATPRPSRTCPARRSTCRSGPAASGVVDIKRLERRARADHRQRRRRRPRQRGVRPAAGALPVPPGLGRHRGARPRRRCSRPRCPTP